MRKSSSFDGYWSRRGRMRGHKVAGCTEMRDPKLFTQILAKYYIFLLCRVYRYITLMHCKYRLRLSCRSIMQNFQLVRVRYTRICFVSSFKPRNTLQGKFQESVSAHDRVSSSFKVTEIVGQTPTVCVKDSLTRLLKNGFLRFYFYTCHRDSFFLGLFIAYIAQGCTYCSAEPRISALNITYRDE